MWCGCGSSCGVVGGSGVVVTVVVVWLVAVVVVWLVAVVVVWLVAVVTV